ncbi:unnamed protein product [Acanthoscelides obtectus]|uniref:Uncharacterized protein n=1 Tax=Acanthoscelides obtectus TaxID=200917 RepID=A0A9P0KGU6_ACAOB|nr:unnamed protein product [Acanthoscelides obtectus]CAK1657550.1 hypothetical protein AOBTE_LOCUS20413 [Acanthoscelides obtectus]
MLDERDEVGLIMFFFVILILFLVIRIFLYCKGQKSRQIETSQQDRVYSISERVQPNEWSSRDAYLTVQHITAENQMNKPNYNDAPPSYEEAMRIVALTTATGESSTVVTVSTLPKEPN